MHVYRHIDRSRIQFDFAVHSPHPGHYDDEIRQLGGRIFVLPRPRFSGLPGYWQALNGVLRREGPFTAVHSHVHFFSGIPLAAAHRAGVPVRIAHSHSTSDGGGGTSHRKVYRRWMRWLIFRHATHMLGCSRLACEALYGPKCWQEQRVRVVHNGIDLAPFKSLPNDKKALRVKVGLPEEGLLIGHIGRFDTPKNHRFLIEVFEVLAARLPDARLILVGDGPLRPEIQRLVTSKGLQDRVLFLGIRADVPEIMRSLDLFLFPSLYEGFGLVLIEAQASGLPCVISDVIPEEADVVTPLVRRLSLYQPPSVWAEAVVEMQHHKGRMISPTQALELVSQSPFNICNSVRELEEVYEEGMRPG
ncbi:MAG: glycosyltransferase family 1 protein [Thermoproteota archaeon]